MATDPSSDCEPGEATLSWTKRATVLFVFGLIVAGILASLQTQRSGNEQLHFTLATFPVWGVSGAFIGSVYPLVDHWIYGAVHDFKIDWSNAVRSVAILIGIHQASTKIPFSNYYELGGTLAFLAIGLWWMSDRSRTGFFNAMWLSLFGVAISMAARSVGFSRSGEPGFVYLSEWCVSYAACVSFGTIGRILATKPTERNRRTFVNTDKAHSD